MKITKDLTIQQVIQMDNRAAAVFMRHGMFCVGCPAASAESIEQAAMGHNIDLDTLLDDLNEMIEN
jgi:hybrid cluster-associated redox disulfide protein